MHASPTLTLTSTAVVLAAKLSAQPIPPTTANSAILLLKNGASKKNTVDRGRTAHRTLLSTAADDAVQTMQSVLQPVGDISDMLALGATPASPYVPAGDAGVWVSAVNQAGRSLALLPLEAGATAAGAPGEQVDPITNAQIQFSGPFSGPCTTGMLQSF